MRRKAKFFRFLGYAQKTKVSAFTFYNSIELVKSNFKISWARQATMFAIEFEIAFLACGNTNIVKYCSYNVVLSFMCLLVAIIVQKKNCDLFIFVL